MQITESAQITATPQQVWDVLTDFAGYERWNPFVVAISGPLTVGERIKVRIQPPGGWGATIRPHLTVVEPQRQLAWLGRLAIPGLFEGTHSFSLEATPDGGTRFTQSETFRGLLVPVYQSQFAKVRNGFRQMNGALAAESSARKAADDTQAQTA